CDGASAVSVGTGLFCVIVKFNVPENPPPGAGLNTETCAVPALAMSLAGICALTCVALTKVVARLSPFQRTTEPLTKFVPVTVKVKAALPAMADFGVRRLKARRGGG